MRSARRRRSRAAKRPGTRSMRLGGGAAAGTAGGHPNTHRSAHRRRTTSTLVGGNLIVFFSNRICHSHTARTCGALSSCPEAPHHTHTTHIFPPTKCRTVDPAHCCRRRRRHRHRRRSRLAFPQGWPPPGVCVCLWLADGRPCSFRWCLCVYELGRSQPRTGIDRVEGPRRRRRRRPLFVSRLVVVVMSFRLLERFWPGATRYTPMRKAHIHIHTLRWLHN